MGSKKQEEDDEVRDHVSEISDQRSSGNEVEVFSNPIGFVPRFPAPPKYVKVKAQNRRQRDFDRLFLAQILLEEEKKKRDSKTPDIDTKIHGINDKPQEAQATPSRNPNRAIWAAELSRDGKYLAAAGQDMKVRVWEVISTPEHRETDENAVADGFDDSDTARLNAPVFRPKLIREYDGHTASILDLSWSKNNFLLSSSMDKTVRLYHVTREECLCAFKHNDFVTSIQFHPRDDRFFLAGSLDSRIRLWSIPDKTVAYMQQTPDMVTAVAFTPDGKTSIAGCLNGICILFDTEGLKAHSQIHVKSARGKNSKGSKVTGIDTIAIPRENGPPSVKLLITSNDSRIRMYNLKDRNLEVKFRGHENSCSQIRATFSDDGKYVICGSEDKKVYIWPTGPVERPDSDKRPVEVFEAHSSIVTLALMASTKTRRALAQSGDPLYDLCNPPPVTLVSRAESIVSSKAPTNRSTASEERERNSSSPKRAPESPAYLNRHSHVGGHIFITADYTGQIKIFRQDCAYQKRRAESWDTSSVFSRKILARSNSIARRSSNGSSMHRASLNLGSKNHSADRILSWRNSISGNSVSNSTTGAVPNSVSESNLRASISEEPTGDTSPSRRWTHRLSLRSSPRRTSLTKDPAKDPNTSIPPTHSPLVPSSSNAANIAIQVASPPQSPETNSFPYPQDRKPSSPDIGPGALSRNPSDISAITDTSSAAASPMGRPPTNSQIPHDTNNALFLMDGVNGPSMRAWDMERTVMPMARRLPRTPGLLGGMEDVQGEGYMGARQRRGSGGSRGSKGAGSVLSLLSSEEEEEAVESVEGGEDENLSCRQCGNGTFKATVAVADVGGHRLRCRRCGTVQ